MCSEMPSLLSTALQCLLRFAQAAAFDMLKLAASYERRRNVMKQRANYYFQQRRSNLLTHAIAAWNVRAFGPSARQSSRGWAHHDACPRLFSEQKASYPPGTPCSHDMEASTFVSICGVNPSPPSRGASQDEREPLCTSLCSHLPWPCPPSSSPRTPCTPHFCVDVETEIRTGGRLCAPPSTPDCAEPVVWSDMENTRSGPKMVLFR